MATVSMYAARSSTITAGNSNYASYGTAVISSSGAENNDTRSVVTRAGTLANLVIRISANATTSPSTIASRISGSAGNQSATITTGTPGEYTDLTHSDYVVVGDRVNMLLTNGGGGSLTRTVEGMTFASILRTMCFYGLFNALATTPASSTAFNRWSPQGGASTTESVGMQFQILTPGTFGYATIDTALTGRSTDSIYGFRFNGLTGGGAGVCTVTVPGGAASGIFTDNGSTDPVVSGDLVDVYCTFGSGTGGVAGLFQEMQETVDGSQMFVTVANTVVGSEPAYTTSVVRYEGVFGAIIQASTEGDLKTRIGAPGTVSNYSVYVASDTITASSTVKFRKNAGAGNGSISIPSSSAAGWYQDLVNSDTLAAGDEVDWELTAGGTGTSIKLGFYAAKYTIAERIASLLPSVGVGN